MARAAWLLAFGLWASACAEAVDLDPGADAGLRVEGATFFRAPGPEERGGPLVLGAFLGRTRIVIPEHDKSFSGVAEAHATAIAVRLEGDVGYWSVPTGFPPPEVSSGTGFDAPLSFSARLEPGPRALSVWAIDAQGRAGAATRIELELAPRAGPAGELVVSLFWDTPSDLDLSLTLPDGVEVSKLNTNSWQRPAGASVDPEAWRSGGILDFDSNAGCVIDGRQNENIVWSEPPPSGRYTVRVGTFSLCGAEAARFTVAVTLRGRRIAAASGASQGPATRFRDARAGLHVLEFDVP